MVVDTPEPWWVLPLVIVLGAVGCTLFVMFDQEILHAVEWVLVHILVLLHLNR